MKKKTRKPLHEEFEVIQRAVNGDQRAYEELMNRHHKDVYLEIYTRIRDEDTAKDLAIEAMTKAFTQLHTYQPTFTFGTWLKRVTVNHTIDYLRKRKLYTTSSDEVYDYDEGEMRIQVADYQPDPAEMLEKKQRAAIVRNYVSKLKEAYRSLIELRYFNELSYEEIAETLGIPLGTVKARLHRAKGMLNQMMLQSQRSF